MPQLEYFLIAESASVDQGSNRLSLFNILEEIRGVELPPEFVVPRGVIPQLVAASSWILSQDEMGRDFDVSLRVHFPGQEEPVELGGMPFKGERRRQRILQFIVGFQVKGVGEMRFEVLIDGQYGASHTVLVAHDHARPFAKSTSKSGAPAQSVE